MNPKLSTIVGVLILAALLLSGFVGGCMWGWPKYRIYNLGLRGQAALAEAEWNRRVAVLEANAKRDAAVALAGAEVERARGVASANRIIGASLEGNEAYLRYLFVQGLNDRQGGEVIYVPTEASLPILEAQRLAPKPVPQVAK